MTSLAEGRLQDHADDDQDLPPSFLDSKRGLRILAAFVKDSIVDAAADLAAEKLVEHRLVELFACQYVPEVLEQLSEPAKGALPAAQEELNMLKSILEQFSRNFHAPEIRTGLSASPDRVVPLDELTKTYARTIWEAMPQPLYQQHEQPFCHPDGPDHFVSSLKPSFTLNSLSTLARCEQNVLNPAYVSLSASRQQTLDGLRASLFQARADTIQTCGGIVELAELPAPLSLRYDDADGTTKKIVFDSIDARKTASPMVDQLVAACEQATFGLKGENVLDLDYRRALQLDPKNFSCNFHPSDYGILDSIRQLMLPLSHGTHGVHAELYKLNIYGPSGKFKPHVDTPRSETQFASLVVCLPCAHDGGQLAIRDSYAAMEYTWGESLSCIEWAAFYSECEHEVLEVTSGWRITLTYNLHVCTTLRPTKALAPPSLSIESLPLHENVKDLLNNPSGVPVGSLIGFHCQHPYPRSNHDNLITVEACLKGIDRSLFLVLKHLGFQVAVRPVLDRAELEEKAEMFDDDMHDPDDSTKSDTSIEGPWDHAIMHAADDPMKSDTNIDRPWDPAFNLVLKDAEDESHLPKLTYEMSPRRGDMDNMTFTERLQEIMAIRRIKGLRDADIVPTSGVDRVGHRFVVDLLNHQHEEDSDSMFENWQTVHGIQWLNQPKCNDLGLAYIAYGNQAEMDYYYASAAIIARVPLFGLDAHIQRGNR